MTVNYSVGGTATPGIDYMALSGSLSFSAFSDVAYLNLSAIDDSIPEYSEAVQLNLATGSGYTIGTLNGATVIIRDNEQPVVMVEKIADAIEGGSNGLFRFSRMGDMSQSLLINYSTNESTAESGPDYTPIGTQVTIAAGNPTADIGIDATDDLTTEGREWVLVTVQSGTGYNPSPDTSVVMIADNDDAQWLVESDAVAYPDEASAIEVLANDPGTQSGTLTVIGYSQTLHGTVTLNANQTFSYTSTNLQANGSDFFTYTVTNGQGQFAIGRVTVVRTTPIAADAPKVMVPEVGEVVQVTDNPAIPPANTNPTGLRVVFIFGPSKDRNLWTKTAREYFGPGVWLYNDVTDIAGMAAKLGQFPAGSVHLLTMTGHGFPGGLIISETSPQRVWNDQELERATNAGAVQTIKNTLGMVGQDRPEIRVECCSYGKNTADIQKVADLLNADVWGCKNYIGAWGDPNAQWVKRSPK